MVGMASAHAHHLPSIPPDARQQLGRDGEAAARNALRSHGYVILAERYRVPHGEVDIVARDDQTIVFGQRTSRVYVANLRSPCDNLDQPGFALVTRTPGSGMCSGDIATVVQTTSGMTAGSCVIGTFTPYTRP